jgi:hypothetical protein
MIKKIQLSAFLTTLVSGCCRLRTEFQFFGQEPMISLSGRYIPTDTPSGTVIFNFFNDSATLYFEGSSYSNLSATSFSDTLKVETCKKCINQSFYPCGTKTDCNKCNNYFDEKCRYKGIHSLVYFDSDGVLKSELLLPNSYERHTYTLMRIKTDNE